MWKLPDQEDVEVTVEIALHEFLNTLGVSATHQRFLEGDETLQNDAEAMDYSEHSSKNINGCNPMISTIPS